MLLGWPSSPSRETSLTESKLIELHDKQFDKLFEKHKAKWMEVTGNAYQVTKGHVCGGKPRRQDDVLKALTLMLETNESLRKHQEETKSHSRSALETGDAFPLDQSLAQRVRA